VEHRSEIEDALGLVRILLVEPCEEGARKLGGLLAESGGPAFEIAHVKSLPEAKRLTTRETFHLVLLNPARPEGQSLDAVLRAMTHRTVGAPVLLLVGPEDEAAAQTAVQRGQAQDYLVAGHLDGRLLGHAVLYALERRRMLASIRRLRQAEPSAASLDRLTRLPNRQAFHDRLENALDEARRHGQMVAVLLVGLEGFKLVHDTLGPAVGDPLLGGIAERLTGGLAQFLRSGDTVARLSGEEFAVVLGHVPQMDEVSFAADALLEAFAPPFRLEGLEFFMTCSVGIAVHPFDGADASSLLHSADIALRRSREQGGNSVQFYLPAVNDRFLSRLELQNSLRIALARDEFQVHYMPQRDVATGRIVSMEALARWKHPTLGTIPPSDFIPLAEETGLILPLGERILRSACAQTRQWHEQGLPRIRVSVNVSPRQFQRQNPVHLVERVLADTKLDPDRLELEITESAVMKDADAALETLRGLKSLGAGLAIDDFGTGYSSLSYLRSFPIDALKVDRSFVREVPARTDDAAIVTAIIAMARSLKLRVIAEGVESHVQQDWLRSHGCDEIQGYLISRPLPAEQIGPMLAKERP
jgi:diguanylate cyclase (GGDEF)-like protein